MEDVQGIDPYEVVLADLRAERAKLDEMIERTEEFRRKALGLPVRSPRTRSSPTGSGPYAGLTIADAARKLLVERGCAMSNTEIAEALAEGGLGVNSNDPINTVSSVLNRRLHQFGDVQRAGRGYWKAETHSQPPPRDVRSSVTSIPLATATQRAAPPTDDLDDEISF